MGARDVRGSWSVVCTALYDAEKIAAFAAHHVALGADEVFVFIDDAVTGSLPNIPKLTLIECNTAYWAQNNTARPDRRVRRQSFNANLARDQFCTSHWICHIDLDEFIHLRRGTTVADLLQAVPMAFPAARLCPAERMFLSRAEAISGAYTGFFKLNRGETGLSGHIYDPNIAALVPTGFQGHVQGKSFARTDAAGRISIHRLKIDGKPARHFLIPDDHAVVLHLYPLNFSDWKAKFDFRADNPALLAGLDPAEQDRYRTYSDLLANGDPALVLEYFFSLCVIGPQAAETVEAMGLGFTAQLDDAIQAALPAPYQPDRSVVAQDMRA